MNNDEIRIILIIITIIVTMMIVTIIGTGSCSLIKDLVRQEGLYQEQFSKLYKFEVYQKGVKIDEVYLNGMSSFIEDNVYYKWIGEIYNKE